MASRQYRFKHSLGRDGAAGRIESMLSELTSRYGLTREDRGPGSYRLHRSGVEAFVAVGDADVTIDVELGWLLEKTVRGTLEDTLNRKVGLLLG